MFIYVSILLFVTERGSKQLMTSKFPEEFAPKYYLNTILL